MARVEDTERRVIRRTQPQPIAPGEPPPGTGLPVPPPGPQAAPEYVQPFSYTSPLYNPGRGARSSQYNYQVPQVPQFYAPEFQIPRAEAVFNDPSYQFRLDQGLDALERSAAARGMLRSGNTLQDLMRYGQDYASQEYGNMFNRAAQAYGINYEGLRDMYAPNLAMWQAQAQAEQDRARYGADDAWRRYELGALMHRYGLDDQFRREQMLFQGGL